MVNNLLFRDTPNSLKSVASPELITELMQENLPPLSIFSTTREFWLTEKALADKSSQSEDSNSLDTSSRSSEALKPEKSNPFLKKKVSLKSLPKAAWEKPTLVKPEENLWLISRDTKSLSSEENSLNSPEPTPTKRNDPSLFKIRYIWDLRKPHMYS